MLRNDFRIELTDPGKDSAGKKPARRVILFAVSGGLPQGSGSRWFALQCGLRRHKVLR